VQHRELLFAWTRRDLASRWRGTFLGAWWALLQPLFMLALYTFVFAIVLKVRFGPGGTGDFALSLWAGLLPWLAFAETATRAAGAIAAQPNLVKKVVFPLELLPASLGLAALANQLIGLALLLVAAAWTGAVFATWAYLPLLLAVQLAFTLGVAWLLASLGVFIRDLAAAIGLVLNAWMYLSPVLYPASLVPEAYRGWFMLNPVALWAEATRGVVLLGQAPDPRLLAGHALLAALTLGLGLWFFTRTRRAFADVL
jgi:lipopolysaccharide transport system permease protein